MGVIKSRVNCIVIDNIRFADDVTKLGQGKFAYAEGGRKNIDVRGSYTPDTEGTDDNRRNRRNRNQGAENVEQL